MIVMLAACTGGTGTPTPTDDTDTGTPVTFTLPADLAMTDGENYAIESTWEVPSTQIASAPAQVLVDWSTHTTDVTGATREADSFAYLVLLESQATPSELQDRMGLDDVESVLLRTFALDVYDGTDAVMTDFPGFDPQVDLVEDPAKSWLLGLADATSPKIDLKDAIVLVPTATQPGFVVTIPDGAASFEYLVQIDGIDTLRTDAGHDRYTVDWSALTADAYGKPFDASKVDEVFVARFDDQEEADDLASYVLDLEAVATGYWTVPASGTSADLTAGGFPGFEADVPWLVGGLCTPCFGKAPLWMAVVEVRAP